jgi:hypothetical protein
MVQTEACGEATHTQDRLTPEAFEAIRMLQERAKHCDDAVELFTKQIEERKVWIERNKQEASSLRLAIQSMTTSGVGGDPARHDMTNPLPNPNLQGDEG